jgi:hypothetical protein
MAADVIKGIRVNRPGCRRAICRKTAVFNKAEVAQPLGGPHICPGFGKPGPVPAFAQCKHRFLLMPCDPLASIYISMWQCRAKSIR